MRKALIGILMAATMATPLAAQDNNGWHHDRGGGRTERSEGRGNARQEQAAPVQQQAAQPAPQPAPQAEPQRQGRGDQAQRGQWQGRGDQARRDQGQRGQWQGRGDQGQGQRQRQQWQGNGGQAGNGQAGWQGRGNDGRGNDGRQALEQRIQDSREASQRSAEGVIPSYQRQAARNQQRYENQLRNDYQQDRRGNDGYRRDGNGNNRGNDWGRNDGRRSSYSWNRGWRNDNRYDWQRYRYSNRNAFHVGAYYAPYRGYNYNRLGIGVFLDSVFFGQNYWIGDPYDYHLPPSPPGTQWVRYYNDVVLVDVYTGQVVDVIYDFFW